ncbi:MAG: hypothetical protein ACTHMM_18245 [Agriterribacter sp.]
MSKIALFLLILPVVVFAQRRDNAIMVQSVSFKEAALALLDNGFNIEKSDSSLGIIYCEPKAIGKLDAYGIVRVRSVDTGIIITGDYQVPSVDKNYSRIDNRGMKGSPARRAWDMLDEFAKSFNKPLKYLSK